MQDRPTQIDRQDARQAKAGLNVRWVLTAGTALVIVAFALIWLFH